MNKRGKEYLGGETELPERRRVLIIDDDPAFHSNLMNSVILNRDFDFFSVYNGPDGLISLKREEWDLCLLDLNLSNKLKNEGFEILQTIKKIYPSMPVIVVTQEDKDEILIHAMKYGADYFLKKSSYDVHAWSKLFIEIILEQPKPEILLIDNDEIFILNFRRAFRRNFRIQIAYSFSEAELQILSSNFAVVLIALNMYEYSSQIHEFFEEFQTQNPYLPMIILSEKEEKVPEFILQEDIFILAKSQYSKSSWRSKINTIIKASRKKKSAENESIELERRLSKESISEDEKLSIHKKLEKLYDFLSNMQKRDFHNREYKKLLFKINSNKNLFKRIKIRSVSISDIGVFSSLSWEVDPKVNVLLGRNGSGKSLLLRLVCIALNQDIGIASLFLPLTIDAEKLVLQLDLEGKLENIRYPFLELFGKVPLIAFSDIRYVERDVDKVHSPPHNLLEDGAFNLTNEKTEKDRINGFLGELAVRFFDKGKREDQDSAFGIAERNDNIEKDKFFSIIENVMQELSDIKHFVIRRVIKSDIGTYSILVNTDYYPNSSNPQPIQKISRGTMSTVAIFGLIYLYLERLAQLRKLERDKEIDVKEEDCIVIIDEIDAHLHPVWQQRILFMLTEKFPNIQLIVSAHSPLIVAGRLEGQVATLRKENDKMILEKSDTDYMFRSPNNLYQEIFGIEENDLNYKHYSKLIPKIEKLKKDKTALEKMLEEEIDDDAGLEKKLKKISEDLYYTRKVKHYRLRRRRYSEIFKDVDIKD